MKICIIGSVGVPASYGGFETLAERLIETDHVKFRVYCSAKHYNNRISKYKNAELVYIPIDANGISSIIYDSFSMLHALISGHKNFLVLGVSGAIFFPILTLFPKIKIITNIDGIEWKRKKWNRLAKYFLKFSEYLAIKFSSQIVSDNDAITSYISQEYNTNCKTISYGGDHAFIQNPHKTLDANINISSPYALSICRIEPENNIHIILDAFVKINLRVIFVGNWNNSEYGRGLLNKYQDINNIILLNPIYCLDNLHVLRSSCSVYIHGHSAGGTNPSLVEIMHFAKPVVAFDCSFNRASMENKGNYFSCSKTLVSILEEFNKLGSGDEMAEIAMRRYTWKNVRKQYLQLFNS